MKKQKKIVINSPHVQNIAKTLRNTGKQEIYSDTTGSYTGIGIKGERPVQDADDL